MGQVADYIKRAAEHTKYKRVSFVEKNMPTVPSNVYAIPFYGDLESTFILSSLLLRTFKEKNPDKYLVLCSWPGFQGLFPYVDEYWTLEDTSVTNKLAMGANNFYNESNISTELTRGLMECINVMPHREWGELWNRGFTDNYWKTYDGVYRYLPEIPSSSMISESFVAQLGQKKGRKILIYPVTRMQSWQKGKSVYLPISKEFWSLLIERFLEEGYAPVVCQNWFTYDMSQDFTERCVCFAPKTVTDLLTAMNYIGLVLDVFSGISRMAIASRTPYISVAERQKYIEYQDYAVDDLCNQENRQYIYSFSTMLMAGSPKEWNASLIDGIFVRLANTNFVSSVSSTNETYEKISYSQVRDRKVRRMGVTFINSSKDR